MKKRIRFSEPELDLPSDLDGRRVRFGYEDLSENKTSSVIIGIAGGVLTKWGFNSYLKGEEEELKNTLFPFAINQVLYNNGESLILYEKNSPDSRPSSRDDYNEIIEL